MECIFYLLGGRPHWIGCLCFSVPSCAIGLDGVIVAAATTCRSCCGSTRSLSCFTQVLPIYIKLLGHGESLDSLPRRRRPVYHYWPRWEFVLADLPWPWLLMFLSCWCKHALLDSVLASRCRLCVCVPWFIWFFGDRKFFMEHLFVLMLASNVCCCTYATRDNAGVLLA